MIRNKSKFMGASLVGAGSLLLVVVGAYIAYTSWAKASLDDLVVDRRGSIEDLLLPGGSLPLSAPPFTAGNGVLNNELPLSPTSVETGDLDVDVFIPLAPDAGDPLDSGGTVDSGDPLDGYDGQYLTAPDPSLTLPSSESNALPAGSGGTQAAYLTDFQPVDWAALPNDGDLLPQATRIEIPAISLDSSIIELNTNWVGERLVWETPERVVGYHNGTANPGTSGNTVLSGHISSPLRREGAIFSDLPQVAPLLKEGRTVDVILHTADARYLYRVVETRVSKPADVDLFRPATEPSLTLLTCIPDYVYSDRLLVSAILVGKAPLD